MEDYDVFGNVIQDYFDGNKTARIIVHSEGFDHQFINGSQLFRTKENLPNLEKEALRHCRGKILDIGAGAGCHSIILQNEGAEVTALELSSMASEVIKKMGVRKVINKNIFEYDDDKFDTLLLLMNGIGIAGTLSELDSFLAHLKSLLNPGGVILAESSDLLYWADDEEMQDALNADEYYGEVKYHLEYKGQFGKPFDWLFLDFNTLAHHSAKQGLNCELLFQDFEGGFLVKLYPI